MYNEQQKNEFLSFVNDQKSFMRVFNKISNFESEMETDFSMMNLDMQKMVLNLISVSRSTTNNNFVSMLRIYQQWCIDNARAPKKRNSLTRISGTDINSESAFRFAFIKDPSELISIMEAIFAPITEDKIDNMYRVYLLLCYNRLNQQEAVDLPISSVDMESQRIYLNDRTIQILPEMVDTINYVLAMQNINIQQHQRETGKIMVKQYAKPLIVEDKVIRSYRYSNNRRVALNYAVSCLATAALKEKRISKPIRLSNIFLSGWFYHLYRNEPVQFEDFEQMVIETRPEVRDKATQRKTIIKSIRSDYTAWKRAFDLS